MTTILSIIGRLIVATVCLAMLLLVLVSAATGHVPNADANARATAWDICHLTDCYAFQVRPCELTREHRADCFYHGYSSWGECWGWIRVGHETRYWENLACYTY